MAELHLQGTPTGAVQSDEVSTRGLNKPLEIGDPAALKIVKQDTDSAESWIQQRQWALGWQESDVLYQSPRSYQAFENSATPRANVSRFTVAKHVNSLVPTMKSGIFYESPPFVLRPRPGTTQSTVRAKSALYSALLDEMEFEAECERAMECQCLNGTVICKAGWTTDTTIQKRFVRKKPPIRVSLPLSDKDAIVHTAASDEFEVKEIEITTNRPWFEMCDLGEVLVDPGWKKANQIHKAKFIIHVKYVTFDDIRKLAQDPDYTWPEEFKNEDGEFDLDKVIEFFTPISPTATAPSSIIRQQDQSLAIHHADGPQNVTTENPEQKPIKLVERWDRYRVMTTLENRVVIKNKEHGFSRMPFFSANWWNIQNAGYGLGVGRIVGADQRVEQGSTNAALDILAFAANPQYVRSRGSNILTQQIRQRLGGILDADGDPEKAFRLVEQPKVPPELWTAIQQAKQSAEGATGADEAMVGGVMPNRGGSSIGRTATGAGNLAAASASRIQGPVGRFVFGILVPYMKFLDEMVNERMPLSEIRQVLSDEYAEDIEVDFNNFLNAGLKFEVLAGAKLAAKKAMAQALPLMVQILENPHLITQLNATGWTVDVREIFEMFMEMSEWKNSRELIRKMDQQELSMYQEMNSPTAKIQGDLEKEKQKFDNKSRLVDQQADQRLAHDLVMDASERAAGYEERQAFYRGTEQSPYLAT